MTTTTQTETLPAPETGSKPSREDYLATARVLRFHARICERDIANMGFWETLWNWSENRMVLQIFNRLASLADEDAESLPPNTKPSGGKEKV